MRDGKDLMQHGHGKSLFAPKNFDMTYYMNKKDKDHNQIYADKFGSIRPGCLEGTNIKFRGKDDGINNKHSGESEGGDV